MDNFGIKDIVYIVGIVSTTVGTFFITKHNLKEFVRDNIEKLKDELHKHTVEMEKLKSKDELQQQIIDQFQKQVLEHMPNLSKFTEYLRNSEENGRRK